MMGRFFRSLALMNQRPTGASPVGRFVLVQAAWNCCRSCTRTKLDHCDYARSIQMDLSRQSLDRL